MADASAVERDAPVDVRPSVAARLRESALALDVALASGMALVAGMIRLGAPSLWVDESFTARAVDLRFGQLLDHQYHVLYYVLLKPWVAIAGSSEAALRFPSVLGTMLSCALLVLLAHKLFDRRVALVGGLFLALSPFLVKWSQQARGYTLIVAVALLASLLLVRALERESRSAWAIYGARVRLAVAAELWKR